MKGFIAIILFFVLALAGVKTGHLSVASSIAVPGNVLCKMTVSLTHIL